MYSYVISQTQGTCTTLHQIELMTIKIFHRLKQAFDSDLPIPAGCVLTPSGSRELTKKEYVPISKYQQLTFHFPHITDTHPPTMRHLAEDTTDPCVPVFSLRP